MIYYIMNGGKKSNFKIFFLKLHSKRNTGKKKEKKLRYFIIENIDL